MKSTPSLKPCQIAVLVLLGWLTPFIAFSQQPDAQPNIVFLMADDLGFSDLKPAYMPRTWAILQNQGMRIPFFSAQNCAPSRAALMTGKLPSNLGITGVDPIQLYDGLPLSETLLSEKLKEAGYRTGIFGKWHLGLDHDQNPLFQGFDEFTGFVHGQINYYGTNPDGSPYPDGTSGHDHHNAHDFQKNNLPYFTDKYSTWVFRDAAINFINNSVGDDTPFFAYVPFNAPHAPYAAPKSYVDFYRENFNVTQAQYDELYEYAGGTMAIPRRAILGEVTESRLNKLLYYSSVRALDDAVADIFETLQSTGQLADTFFMFTSDNGAATFGSSVGNNAPYRAGKGSPYEGGHRVPNVVVWPDSLRTNNNVRVNVWIGDLFETLLAIAGAPTNDPAIESNNLLEDMLSGTSTSLRKNGNNYITAHISKIYKKKNGDTVVAIWTANSGHMKYIRSVLFNLAGDVTNTNEELYDLHADRGETTDVKQESSYTDDIVTFRESYQVNGGDAFLRSRPPTLLSTDVGIVGYTFPEEWGFSNRPKLTLSISSDFVDETAGNFATSATVTRPLDTTGELLVSLFSHEYTDIKIPNSLIIPEGQISSAPFQIDVIDNTIVNGIKVAKIKASAIGHAAAFASISIVDNEIDSDGDLVQNSEDNCPFVPNPEQHDDDDNGLGNACEPNNDLLCFVVKNLEGSFVPICF